MAVTETVTSTESPAPTGPSITKRAQVMTLLAAFLGWMFDGMEMGIFPLVARPLLKEMQAGSGVMNEAFIQHWMGIITAAFLFGAAGGGLVFGWLGDRIGRVKALSMSILCYSVFTGLCYFAQEPWQLGVMRFIAALGMGGEWSLGVALVMEAWPARLRPMMAGIIGAAANVGFVLVGVIGFIWPVTEDSWRWMFLVGAAPALLTFIIRLFVPESEKWKQAVAAADRKIRPVREILSPPLLGRTLFATAFASIPLFVTWGVVQWIATWTDQMAGPGNPKAKAIVHMIIAVAAIFGCLAAAMAGQKFGRRLAYFGLCVLAIASSAFLFLGVDSYGPKLLVGVTLVGFFSAAFFGWLPLYLPELFPTRVRATAQGLAFNFGRILAAIGTWNMGAIMGLFDNSYARAGMAISLVYALGMFLIWLAPETKGKPLPE